MWDHTKKDRRAQVAAIICSHARCRGSPTITVSRLPRGWYGVFPTETRHDSHDDDKIAPIPAGRLEGAVRCGAEPATDTVDRPRRGLPWHGALTWVCDPTLQMATERRAR
jgi:hypothetical protein